jgi:hypothetical protein
MLHLSVSSRSRQPDAPGAGAGDPLVLGKLFKFNRENREAIGR